MSNKRRFHNSSFKFQVALEAASGTKTISQLASQYQVHPNQIGQWKRQLLGNATDLNTAYREGAFGQSPKPFLGYFFVLEECPASMAPVQFISPHFFALPEFHDTSYAARYDILWRKLVQEQLYDAAALVLTEKEAHESGDWRSLSELSGPRRFATTLTGRIAGMSAE